MIIMQDNKIHEMKWIQDMLRERYGNHIGLRMLKDLADHIQESQAMPIAPIHVQVKKYSPANVRQASARLKRVQ